MVTKKTTINADGSQIEDIEIISVGLSGHNNLCSAEVLKESFSLFEDAPLLNHFPTLGIAEDIGQFQENLIGRISDVEFTDDAIWCGKVMIRPNFVAEVRARIEAGGQPRLRMDVSASIGRGVQDGKEIRVVDKIHIVHGVVLDWEEMTLKEPS